MEVFRIHWRTWGCSRGLPALPAAASAPGAALKPPSFVLNPVVSMICHSAHNVLMHTTTMAQLGNPNEAEAMQPSLHCSACVGIDVHVSSLASKAHPSFCCTIMENASRVLKTSFVPRKASQASLKLLSRQKAVLLQSGTEPSLHSMAVRSSLKLSCAAQPCTCP